MNILVTLQCYKLLHAAADCSVTLTLLRTCNLNNILRIKIFKSFSCKSSQSNNVANPWYYSYQ